MIRFTLLFCLLPLIAVGADDAIQPNDIPLERFAQLPMISGASLSPDGVWIAYLRPIDGRNALIVQKLFSTDSAVAVPPMGDLDFEWAHWATNERIVFSMSFSARRHLTESKETRLLAVDRSGRNIVALIEPARAGRTGSRVESVELATPQIQDDVIDWLKHDPEHILVALDEDFDEKWEVRKVNIIDGSYDVHRNGTTGIQNWVVDQSHEIRIGYGYDGSTFTMMVKPPGAPWTHAERHDWWAQGYRPIAFGVDSRIAYVRGYTETGFRSVRKMRLADGALLDPVFEHDEFDANELVRDPVTNAPVGVRFVRDIGEVNYFEPAFRVLQASLDKAFPDTANEIVSMSDDRRRVLVRAHSDIEPGLYYYWDRQNKTVDTIAVAMPGLSPKLLSPVQPVRFEARDGLRIPGYLTVPRGKEPSDLPSVVLPHGGPAARDDRSFWFLSQFLASRGYAVLQPNFRGSSGYGLDFELAGRGEWGGKMQDDVTDGARWLIEEGIADPKRLCIVGWSYGGYAAAMGAVKTPDLYQCAASVNGVMNLPAMIDDDRDYIGGSAWTRHVGLDGARAASVSPYHQAENIRIPLLIVQSQDDARIHVDQGEGMYKRLKRLDKQVKYVTVEHGGHRMYNEPARLIILQSLESFLGRHIGAAN